MFTNLLQFELFYQRKQRSLLLFSVIFLLYGLLLGSQGFAPANVNFNSGYQIAYYTALMTLGLVFIIMFFAVSGILRDKQHNFESIIYSTSIQKGHYFLSRFIGVFIFSVLAFSPFFIGFVIGNLSPDLDPDRLTSLNLFSHLWALLLFVLPNTFICTAVVFATSILTKNSVATYIAGISIYVLYILSSIFLNSPLMAQSIPATPEGLMLAALADPFGIAAFFEQTQLWTPFQKNSQLVSLSGNFLWNRIIWTTAALGITAVAYRLFSFRKVDQKIKKERIITDAKVSVKPYKPVGIAITLKSEWLAFRSLLNLGLSGVFKSLPFLGVCLIWIILIAGEFQAKIIGGGEYNDSRYATTDLMITILSEPLQMLSLILIIFYSAELTSRAKDYKFDGIVDATPATNIVFFSARLFAVILLPILLISSGILIAIFFQIFTGYYQFEWGLYASMFYYNGMSLLFYSLFAMFILSLIPNKYLGMGVTGIAILMLGIFSSSVGIEHPMFRLGFIPVPDYTNMNGYSISTKAFNHFTLYWLSLGGILMTLTFRLLTRGTAPDWRVRLGMIFSGWKTAPRLVFSVSGFAFAFAAFLIYYNVNVVDAYQTVSTNLDLSEAYEKKFKKYETEDRLIYAGLKTEVDLYPSENKYSVKAQYIMKNMNERSITKVLVHENVPISSISFENAVLKEHDTTFGTYLFVFNQALQPGDEVVMTYEVNKEVVGYQQDNTIIENGTYITFRDFEPILGYRSSLEIDDNFIREKRGLPKREEEKVLDEHLIEEGIRYEKTSFETIISTESEQTAISSGDLIETWTKQDRSYFHYKAQVNIVPTIAYFSAKYELQKDKFDSISIELYYHPDHAYNLDEINKSAKLTLEYCSKNFGPYPFNHLRIAEIPGHWNFGGFAHPGMISMVENRLYLIDSRDTNMFNLVAKRTIHEVSHQWWGNTLFPKSVKGASIFVEGFAKYTEAVVMERTYGKGAIWQLSNTANNMYFKGRAYAGSPEPPIYLTDGESYLSYGKQFTVMMALRDLIGEEKVNQVLRKLVERKNAQVTSLDLLNLLYEATPQQNRSLIDDWLKRVITYDLSVDKVYYKKLANGKYEVTISIISKRFQTKENGEQEEIAINEPIMLGIFSQHPNEVHEQPDILYLQPHQVNKTQMEFKVLVDEIPVYVGIDPFGTRSDEDLYNNVIEINR